MRPRSRAIRLLMMGLLSPEVREIVVTGNNVNLRTLHDSLYPASTIEATAAAKIRFTWNLGVTSGSASTATPAIRTGSWPAMTYKPLLTINGRNQGKGGTGGPHGAAGAPDGQPGEIGGVALLVEVQIELGGTGKLFGGGGGAGGGGMSFTESTASNGGSGGGGSGTDPGLGGQTFGLPVAGQTLAAPGTADSGGLGGNGANRPPTQGGRGGDGGGPGLAAGNGLAGSGGSTNGAGGLGAQPGSAIDGVSLVTFVPGHTLDIRGPQIN